MTGIKIVVASACWVLLGLSGPFGVALGAALASGGVGLVEFMLSQQANPRDMVMAGMGRCVLSLHRTVWQARRKCDSGCFGARPK